MRIGRSMKWPSVSRYIDLGSGWLYGGLHSLLSQYQLVWRDPLEYAEVQGPKEKGKKYDINDSGFTKN